MVGLEDDPFPLGVGHFSVENSLFNFGRATQKKGTS